MEIKQKMKYKYSVILSHFNNDNTIKKKMKYKYSLILSHVNNNKIR